MPALIFRLSWILCILNQAINCAARDTSQKLERLEHFGYQADALLKADGKLVAKLKELFSELKANGKLDAAKHLDLLKIKCFSRDTLVHTATGPRPIGDIEPGEQIWSYHFERGVWGLCEVKERLDNTYSGPVISITVDNTTIEATAYHPFWVIEGRDLRERSKPRELQEHEDEGHSLPGRWVNSHELRADDCIITRSGTRAIITEIRQRFDDAFPVSNLSIIGHHNYAVGDVGVLVHNTSICDDAIAVAKRDLSAGKSINEIQDNLNQMVKNGKHTQKEVDDALAKILDPNWKPGGTVGATRTLADQYADAVKSNLPWSWGESIEGGADLTAAQRRAIKQEAIQRGLIPDVPMKAGTRFPDFEAAGLIESVDFLPESLWKSGDTAQFNWLDARIPGGRPAGMTWHHSEIPGRMELVPFGPHNIINHLGGRSPGMWAHGSR